MLTDDWPAYKPLRTEFAWRHNHRHVGHRSMFHELVGEAARQ